MPAHTHTHTLTHSLTLSSSLSLSLSFPSLINRHLIKSLFIKLGLCTAPPPLSLFHGPTAFVVCSTYVPLRPPSNVPITRNMLGALAAVARRSTTRCQNKRARSPHAPSFSLSPPFSLSLSLSVSLAHFGRFIRSPLHREINLIAGEGGGYAEADPITPQSTLTPPPSLHIQSAHV